MKSILANRLSATFNILRNLFTQRVEKKKLTNILFAIFYTGLRNHEDLDNR